MNRYDDIFELLEAVRQWRLAPKECLIPLNSVDGSQLGFCTADCPGVSVSWAMPTRAAKQSALARGTQEAKRIHALLCSHMGRRQLLEELRSGNLEYGVARLSVPEYIQPPQPKQLLLAI